MATAVQMLPPRPSMDHRASFDAPARSRSTPPFSHSASSSFDRSTSPSISQQTRPQHSRSNSNASASASSPYAQPPYASYFPAQPHHPVYGVPQSWSTTALPATAFYSAQAFQNGYPGQVFHQGFQQSHADFNAWAQAYQQMVMASMQQGGGMTPPAQHQPPVDWRGDDAARRRTNSGPQQGGTGSGATTTYGQSYFEHLPRSASQGYVAVPPLAAQKQQQQQQQPGGFHPYKRTGGPQHRPSRDMPRSTSQPSMPSSLSSQSPSSSFSSATTQDHQRTSSLESATSSIVPPPRVGSRQDGRKDSSASSSRDSSQSRGGDSRSSSPAPPSNHRPVSTASTIKAVPSTTTNSMASQSSQVQQQVPQPLHTGPIANAAANQPYTNRPSPLSQTVQASPVPSEKVKASGGLRNRLKKALDKDSSAKKTSTPPSTPSNSNANAPITNSPSFTSTTGTIPATASQPFKSPASLSSSNHSSPPTPTPTTPPQPSDLPQPPRAPFAIANLPQAMGSEVSLATTARTATGDENAMGGKKGKRSLFRMKNMSTDNISLSSTVSSASMMIRKMGSIGKLARRNSLMGISKIFKDKPKDEDAPIPETTSAGPTPTLSKKEKRKAKKDKKKGKAEPASPAVSMATVEAAGPVAGEDDDRALAGLSPAAKLARQHTLRSRAEQEKKAAAEQPNQGGGLPSISSVVEGRRGSTPPEVVHVLPQRQGPTTVVHAVAVSEHEYDSEDDSSEGETLEDVTIGVARARLSDGHVPGRAGEVEGPDEAFMREWGNAWIDRNAVPKKGILKVAHSFTETPEQVIARQRSNSSTSVPTIPRTHSGPLPLAPAVDPLAVPSDNETREEILNISFDSPLSLDTSPAPTPPTSGPYVNPAHNTSAPQLTLFGQPGHSALPQPLRAMTVPGKRRLVWAPECAVYSTYDSGTYDRRSEPATCNRLTPELAMAIKQELNAFKLEMQVHPSSRVYTQYFA